MKKLSSVLSSYLIFLLLSFLVSCMSNETVEQKAARIHNEAITIDTHQDTPMKLLRSFHFSLAESHNPSEGGGKVDFVRMKKGGLDAAFFAVFTSQGERNPESNEMAKQHALEVFDSINTNINRAKNLAELAYSTEDVYRIVKTGKRAILIGMENGYPIGADLGLLERYYKLGARYITLCHTKNNDICDSSTDEKEHDGLSQFGAKVVNEMIRLGIMIDVSHISDKSFYDVLDMVKIPVIASHSCVRSLCDNPRNLSDDMLKRLAENNGVIQITFVSEYLITPEPNPQRDSAMADLRKKYSKYSELSDEEKEKAHDEFSELNKMYPVKLATVKDLVDHIDYVKNLIGIDHVGIGTDFEGGGGLADCFDVSEMGNITLELVKRGYSENDIRKIWGGNLLRVFHDVEKAAQEQLL